MIKPLKYESQILNQTLNIASQESNITRIKHHKNQTSQESNNQTLKHWNIETLKQSNIRTYLASKNLDLRIITASQVLCLSCTWIELNFLWIIWTILSISLGVMGLVLLCSLNKFITCVVNSLHAWNSKQKIYVNNI